MPSLRVRVHLRVGGAGRGVLRGTEEGFGAGQAWRPAQKSVDLSCSEQREQYPAPHSLLTPGPSPGRLSAQCSVNPLHSPNIFFPFWLILLGMISVICDQENKTTPIMCVYNSMGKTLDGYTKIFAVVISGY